MHTESYTHMYIWLFLYMKCHFKEW